MKLNVTSAISPAKVRKFDINDMKKKLLYESRYIVELWKKLPIPVSAQQYVQDNPEAENEYLEPRPVKNKSKHLLTYGKGTTRAKSLQDLHNKFNDMKGKKLVYREKLVRKGIKKKLTKKKKKEERKLKKILTKTQKPDSKLEIESKPAVKPMKPVYNSEGRMVFSKFDFYESGVASEVVGKVTKEKQAPEKMLQRIEKQNEKLKKLETKGEVDKVKEIKEKIAWETAFKKMDGVKVKDNPELLKKTLKKEAQKKKHSKKKWEARVENVKKHLQDRQKKRTDNIQQRKKQVKTKKLKRAAKKGRMVPGF